MEKAKQQRIKPLFTRSITIQNLSKYQDLIKRRYKTTLNFRFTCPEKPLYHANVDNKKTLNKLFKALESLKVLKHADLRGFKVSHHPIIAHKTLAIYKRLPKIKSISVRVNRRDGSLFYTNFKEKWLRNMPALLDLDYEIAGQPYVSVQDIYEARNAKDVENPLRDVKYCPKLQSLQVKVPDYATPFFKSLYYFKQYPLKIKRLSISPENTLQGDPGSSIDCLKNLQFLQLKFNQASCPDFTIRNVSAIVNLTNLQELDMQFSQTMLPEVYTALGKISEKGTVKKLKLKFEKNYQFAGALEALKDCQLTDFSLEGTIFEEKMVAPIANFLHGKTQFQSLKLHITNEYLYNSQNIFEDICKEINTLPALKNLSLNFHTMAKTTKKTAPTTLTSYLQPALSKPIKLEALSLKCNQANPSEEFQSLMTGLQGSTGSLQQLTVDLGTYIPTKQVQDEVISFIKSLGNIRELELPNLDIGAQKFLHDFVEAVYEFKSLRILVVGNIKGTVSKPIFLDAVEDIVKKRGLVKFECSIALDFMKTMLKTSKTAPRIDLKKVQRINPALETIPAVHFVFDDDRFDRNW